MTAVLDLVVPGPSNSIRSDNHPVLEPGNRSFPQGCYRLAFEEVRSPDSGSSNMMTFSLRHEIEKAPFITRLVEEGRAVFACIVSSPLSSYRKTYSSREPRQKIECAMADLGEPPMFTPLVVCTDQIISTLDAETDGVDPIWQDQTITLYKGSRLAVGSIIRLEASIAHLLTMHSDASLESGQFFVEEQTEPYQFSIKLHPELHRFLRYKSDQHVQRNNIIVHIVTACLALLQREWGDGNDERDWESVPNLKALAAHLAARDIPHWTDGEFIPEKAATQLYPLKLMVSDPESAME
ncbi:MAG: hypothetical protein OXE94_11080 [Aestuariivita sp.]|nr:hypothetical protein [Aestuariivita sp.]MCY4201829.1 hypothetical protein [Aestuariivita sp.]